MKKLFNTLKILTIIALCLFISNKAFAQKVKSNTEILFDLISQTSRNFANKGERLILTSNKKEYKPLVLFSENLKFDSELKDTVKATIDSVSVVYIDVFRDGFFGDYKIARKSFILLGFGNGKSIRPVITDTLSADNYPAIENSGFPFAKSELPAEPFWQSLTEPVIFIVTATAIVFALFFGRS